MSTPELAVAVELAPPLSPQALEAVLLSGDLSKLSAADRLAYVKRLCDALGLNALSQPFQYIVLNGKLTLYARRDCTEQLRKLHGVSVRDMTTELIGDVYVVRATLVDRSGRTDQSTGAVPIKGLSGENLANAYMKAETKCKRRGTLSICGLGMLDETEIDSIPGARPEGPPKQPFLPPRRIESKGGDATATEAANQRTVAPATTPTKGGDVEPDESPLTDAELAALDAQDAKEADAEKPITPEQLKRLQTLITVACKGNKDAADWLRMQLHKTILKELGVKSFSDLPRHKYNLICDDWIVKGAKVAIYETGKR